MTTHASILRRMELSPDKFHEEVARGSLRRAYLLHGDAPFLVREAAAAVVRAFTKAQGCSSVDRISLREKPMAAALGVASTVSLFDSARLVVMDGADAALTTPKNERESKRMSGERDALAAYLQNPCPCATVVLVFEGDGKTKINNIYKPVKLLKERQDSALVAFWQPREREMPQWVSRRAEQAGLSLRQDGAEMIADLVGSDLAEAASAIERLLLFVGKTGAAGAADAAACLASTRTHKVFDLVDSMLAGDLRAATTLVHELLNEDDKEAAPLVTVAMLGRGIRQAAEAARLAAGGASQREIGEKLGLFAPGKTGLLVEMGKSLSPARFTRRLEAIFEADRALKSSKAPAGAILQRLVLSFCERKPFDKTRRRG